ncbi:MAG TPA: hypothetical protein VEH83_04350 [Gemmatimonadales bacterium]|nr:hypothetical protein [Gemmatimonadales bacterium]
MDAVLAASAVWCALSVLFAGVHCRWVHYAPAWETAGQRRSSPSALVLCRRQAAPEGADVSEFFRSYGSVGAPATARRGIRLPASVS